MLVADSNPHPLTQRTHDDPYSCKYRVRKRFYPLKQRQLSEDGLSYEMVDTLIEDKMTLGCHHDTGDPRCADCDRKIDEKRN